jgi:vacuolar-type H+-ATPase subunit E/Vma4
MQTMVADLMDKESRQEHAELVACTKEKIAAIERAEALESALKALVDRLDEIRANPDYEAVFFTAQLYRGPYTGPSCEEQYRAARALLNQK